MQHTYRVLTIEDDPDISRLLCVMLAAEGLETVAAYSGTEGLLQLQGTRFDLVLLDLMLPGKSGEELIQEIRQEHSTPILVISAKMETSNKVAVLRMGADDYITKPFDQQEVVARVEVQLRKSQAPPAGQSEVQWRAMTLQVEKRSVLFNQIELPLTNAEFDILALLIQHPERAFSKKEIYERIWSGTYYGDDNTISVHVSNLRKKIAFHTSEDYIKTVWGIGFMLV